MTTTNDKEKVKLNIIDILLLGNAISTQTENQRRKK